MTYILGISALYHDSAAALIKNGEILFAAQEERFTRKKHDPSFPYNSINFVLKEENIDLSEIDYIVFYDKPFLKFERLIESYLSVAPKGFKSFKMAMPIWLKEKLFLKKILIKEFKSINKKFNKNKLLFSEHHISHAASAFYPSPFEKAVILTIDGVGEWTTTSVAIGDKNKIEIKKEIHFPHSIGLLYSAFTFYCGFKVNSGEYKLMGLAPYGKPIYLDLILNNIIDLKDDGSFWLNQKYFNYISGLTMTNKKFSDLFGKPARNAKKDNLEQFHMDMAASIQSVTELILLKITRNISKKYSIKNLCLAGGVALNCVANGKILKDGYFENVYIQPASGDAGGSIGCALAAWYLELKNTRKIEYPDSMKGSYLGPQFYKDEIKKQLDKLNANYKFIKDEDILLKKVAKEISLGKAVGWFQGKMEFGPRALGGRSILADPRSADTQKTLNLKVKFRESFRPFAPSVLKEETKNWFEDNFDSPYMLLVSEVKKEIQKEMLDNEKQLFGIDKLNIQRSKVPAITHVDYSARLQTVEKKINPKFYKLISFFNNLTGCPLLVNTSFNVRGEPIVCSPLDAFKCFMGTNLDILVIENFFLDKSDQNINLKENYKDKYELD